MNSRINHIKFRCHSIPIPIVLARSTLTLPKNAPRMGFSVQKVTIPTKMVHLLGKCWYIKLWSNKTIFWARTLVWVFVKNFDSNLEFEQARFSQWPKWLPFFFQGKSGKLGIFHHEIHGCSNVLVSHHPGFHISQLGWLFPNIWKNKNVPNHQPVHGCLSSLPHFVR